MNSNTIELKPGTELVIKSEGMPSIVLEKRDNGQVHIGFAFGEKNAIFDLGDKCGRPCVRVHPSESYHLRVDEIFGETEDGLVVLKFKNPDSRGGYAMWPDGSEFYIDLEMVDNLLTDPEKIRRFRAWHKREYTGK